MIAVVQGAGSGGPMAIRPGAASEIPFVNRRAEAGKSCQATRQICPPQSAIGWLASLATGPRRHRCLIFGPACRRPMARILRCGSDVVPRS